MTLNTVQFSNRDRTLPGMPLPNATAQRPDPAPSTPKWSGIDRKQMFMGVHDASHIQHSDMHGFVFEPERDGWTKKPVVAEADRNSGNEARLYYAQYGGRNANNPRAQQHWEAQPLHDIPSDALIHTGQHWEHETESGGNPLGNEGRRKIEAIKADLNTGGSIQKPAWIMKHNDRLYALDGHHRIVASRESGKQTFPARVWDRDAE